MKEPTEDELIFLMLESSLIRKITAGIVGNGCRGTLDSPSPGHVLGTAFGVKRGDLFAITGKLFIIMQNYKCVAINFVSDSQLEDISRWVRAGAHSL